MQQLSFAWKRCVCIAGVPSLFMQLRVHPGVCPTTACCLRMPRNGTFRLGAVGSLAVASGAWVSGREQVMGWQARPKSSCRAAQSLVQAGHSCSHYSVRSPYQVGHSAGVFVDTTCDTAALQNWPCRTVDRLVFAVRSLWAGDSSAVVAVRTSPSRVLEVGCAVCSTRTHLCCHCCHPSRLHQLATHTVGCC
jgi:hypothetical protein